MKRLIIILLLFALLFAFWQQIPGDVDGNGFTGPRDVELIKNNILKIEVMNTGQMKRADINKDGRINSTDLTWVIILIK